jgi:uncharacterized membrane protein YheB (UPF0754 family)
MKSIIMPGHEQLDKKAKDQLFKEVKETVAKTIPIAIGKKDQKKTFTVQDMWNRQRRAKSASAMMRRWNLN